MFVLYVAGPTSIRKDSDFNYPAFATAAEQLRDHGYRVISPHEVDPHNPPGSRHYLWYVRQTLRQLLGCQGVAVLPNIHLSSGAIRECDIAMYLKMPILTVDEWLKMDAMECHTSLNVLSWDARYGRIVDTMPIT